MAPGAIICTHVISFQDDAVEADNSCCAQCRGCYWRAGGIVPGSGRHIRQPRYCGFIVENAFFRLARLFPVHHQLLDTSISHKLSALPYFPQANAGSGLFKADRILCRRRGIPSDRPCLLLEGPADHPRCPPPEQGVIPAHLFLR